MARLERAADCDAEIESGLPDSDHASESADAT